MRKIRNKNGQLLLLTGLILTTMMLVIGSLIVMNANVNVSVEKSSFANDYSSFKDKFGYALSDNINSNNTTSVRNAVNKTIMNFKNGLVYQNVLFQGEVDWRNITVNATLNEISVNVSFFIKDDFVKIEENITYVFSAIDFKFIRRS